MSFILPAWRDAQGQFENSGRCNLGVVTLNIPRIAIESQGDKLTFWRLFHERMDILHEALLYRIERVAQAVPENV